MFLTRVLLDPPLRDRLPPVIYLQATALTASGAMEGEPSPVIAVTVTPAPLRPVAAALAGVLAATLLLAFLPGRSREMASRAVAAGALVATPLLLAWAFGPDLVSVAPPALEDPPRSATAIALAIEWAPAALTAIFCLLRGRMDDRRAGSWFETTMAFAALAIVCVPAWQAAAAHPVGIASAAAIVALLGNAGATPAARLVAVLAQACVILAQPLVSLAWTGGPDLPAAAAILGSATALAAPGRVRMAFAPAFLAAGAGLLLREPGVFDELAFTQPPDLRRIPGLIAAIADSQELIALAVPGAATAAVLVLRLRESTRARTWSRAAAACAVLLLALPVLALLATPAYLPGEIDRRLPGILAFAIPLCAGVLATEAACPARSEAGQ